MSGEPSKHLHPSPVQVRTAPSGLSVKDLTSLWRKVSGADPPPDLRMELVNDVADTLSFPHYLSPKEREERVAAALLRLQTIQPQDAAETMLAVQMVATNSAAIDCLRRAASDEYPPEEREEDLRQAYKLMTLYTHQVQALDKHRGKHNRTVTVKHEVVHTTVPAVGRGDIGGELAQGTLRLEKSEAVPIDLATLQSEVGDAVPAGGPK